MLRSALWRRPGESHALGATLLALFWNTPGRSSCYALLFFLKHSSMRLMLRSDLQHVLDARLLRRFFLVLQCALLLIAYTFLLELPHALGAMLLSSDQRSLDAASICLLCYAFSLGPSNALLVLCTKPPHVLTMRRQGGWGSSPMCRRNASSAWAPKVIPKLRVPCKKDQKNYWYFDGRDGISDMAWGKKKLDTKGSKKKLRIFFFDSFYF